MQSILVSSLFYTGTFFVYDAILAPLKKRCIFDEPEDGLQCKYQFHLFEPDQALLKLRMSQCLTIVPFRNYAGVEATWLRHNLDTEVLKVQWEAMQALEGVFHFDIESPQREERLVELSQLIGVNLSTDWALANSLRFAQ